MTKEYGKTLNPHRQYCVLDIETIPDTTKGKIEESILGVEIKDPPKNWKDPEKIAAFRQEQEDNRETLGLENWKRTSLDYDKGEIVCVGWAWAEGHVKSVIRRINRHESEKAMLRRFFVRWLKDMGEIPNRIMPTLVGHNVRGFDLPWIHARMAVHNLAVPAMFSRPESYTHVDDTMVMWRGRYGDAMGRKYVKLTKLMEILNIKDRLGDQGLDGSQVLQMVLDKKMAELAEYCRNDVQNTRQVYRRLIGQGSARIRDPWAIEDQVEKAA